MAKISIIILILFSYCIFGKPEPKPAVVVSSVVKVLEDAKSVGKMLTAAEGKIDPKVIEVLKKMIAGKEKTAG
jgi:hypothetical protein